MTAMDNHADSAAPAYTEIDVSRFVTPGLQHWKSVLAMSLLAGAAGLGLSFAVQPMYTATTTLLPPAQQQGGTASALASLGALSGLAGAAGASRNTPEQYVALMESATVSDRIIEKFGLKKLWEQDYQVDTRKRLAKRVAITARKKDGLIEVDVTDEVPSRAAAIASQYVDELRWITNSIAVTEAQQRRVFFEHLLEQTRDKLAAAQIALESSGYSAGALNVEPKSAAETYAQLRAELTAAQVKLQVLRTGLAESSQEISRQRELVGALTAQVSKLETASRGQSDRSGDYIGRYREFKYQETLFDLFARQYESARVDESREGALVQVVDRATPPERKSSPKRLMFIIVGGFFGLLATMATFAWRVSRLSGRLDQSGSLGSRAKPGTTR